MNRYKFLLATIIYAAGIMWSSLQPDYSGVATPSGLRQAFMNFLHIPAYAGLAGLMMLTYLAIVGDGFKPSLTKNGETGCGMDNACPPLAGIMDKGSSSAPDVVQGKGFDFSIFHVPFSRFKIHYPLFLVLSIFITATLYGVLNEFVQAEIPGRFFSIGDMIRNALGAAIGLWVIGKWGKRNDKII